jgi:hypothetical protein
VDSQRNSHPSTWTVTRAVLVCLWVITTLVRVNEGSVQANMPESSNVLERLLVLQMQAFLFNDVDYSPSLKAAGISTPAEAWAARSELPRRCSLLSEREMAALEFAALQLTGTVCWRTGALLVDGFAELAEKGGCLLCLQATLSPLSGGF